MKYKAKVLLLSTRDFGGAGDASLQVSDSLAKLGYDTKFLVFEKRTKRKDILCFRDYPVQTSIFKKGYYYLSDRIYYIYKYHFCIVNQNDRYCFYNSDRTRVTANQILRKYDDIPDVIIINWVTDFVNSKVIFELKKKTNAKLVFNMTDNACVTGGCHYPFGCEGYKYDCSNCPALNSNKKIAMHTLAKKNKFFSEINCYIWGTSNDCLRAKQSSVFNKANISSLVFIPKIPCILSKKEARDFFNIPLDDYVIFFGAYSISDERKGFNYLLDAISTFLGKIKIRDKKITLLIIGDNYPDFEFDVNIIKSNKLPMKDFYNAFYAADLFICPSVEDSGPMMINYAISCGIPVVSFEMGVALDLIINGKTGYLAKLFDSEDLAKGIEYYYCLSKEESSKIEGHCKAILDEVDKKSSLKAVMKFVINN